MNFMNKLLQRVVPCMNHLQEVSYSGFVLQNSKSIFLHIKIFHFHDHLQCFLCGWMRYVYFLLLLKPHPSFSLDKSHCSIQINEHYFSVVRLTATAHSKFSSRVVNVSIYVLVLLRESFNDA